MLNFSRRIKSNIDIEVAVEQFPVRLTLETMEEMELFHGIFSLLYLSWFLAYHIALVVKTKVAPITTLNCLLENMLASFHIPSKE